jgi:hypothetical protein
MTGQGHKRGAQERLKHDGKVAGGRAPGREQGVEAAGLCGKAGWSKAVNFQEVGEELAVGGGR